MDFDLTEEQAAMERMAKNFAEKEIVPNLKKEEFNRKLVRNMENWDFSAAPFPRGWGVCFGFLAHSVVCEPSPPMIPGCALSSTSSHDCALCHDGMGP